jgi:hypothetical protein
MGGTLMRFLFAAMLIFSGQAVATEYAVIINDAERAALIELINEAVKAKGLDVAQNGVVLANKIKSAGSVVPPDHTSDAPPAPKDDPK